MEQNKQKKKSFWFWKIDEDDLKKQVENYQTLKITRSYRGMSFLIISALLGFSLLLSFFGAYVDPTAMIWGILIYLPILFFVFKGRRWAIVLLMIMWTFEKGYNLYEIGQGGGGSVIMPIIWWLIVMPYFWKALVVENKRRKLVPALKDLSGSVFCHKCGEQLETNSKFCSKCGVKVQSPIMSE
ncbi:zinc ribbon domain-containing protein [Candidatus Parcubacteria bacterium]|nr:zinc ribbon domain-containing protein [Patescibacteria group bacterium]MBU4380766.1 zinc ribbon domain-containing protein [Patescibacteria group bacterium]MCG2688848.1 zinc ribbon domain-containing protein [Candidatus Parcubacteria bacterium]